MNVSTSPSRQPSPHRRPSSTRRPSPNRKKNNVAEVTERPVAGDAASAATIVKIAAEQDGCSVHTSASKDGPPETAVATRRRETPQGPGQKAYPDRLDAYIEQLAEDPRLFLDFRMSKLNHAALVDSDSTRSYMQNDVAARYYQAGGTLAISSFQTTVADGTTVSLDGEIILTAEMAGLEVRHTYAPGDGPPPEARAHALSRTALMAIQRRNRRNQHKSSSTSYWPPNCPASNGYAGPPTQLNTGYA